jgi:hypothetical protein
LREQKSAQLFIFLFFLLLPKSTPTKSVKLQIKFLSPYYIHKRVNAFLPGHCSTQAIRIVLNVSHTQKSLDLETCVPILCRSLKKKEHFDICFKANNSPRFTWGHFTYKSFVCLFVCLFVYSRLSNMPAIRRLSTLLVTGLHPLRHGTLVYIRSHPKDRYPRPTVEFE